MKKVMEGKESGEDGGERKKEIIKKVRRGKGRRDEGRRRNKKKK